MSENGVVIVGAGQGGLQAAISLRQEGYDAPITLIGDEAGLPYQRPPLSKAYLKDGDAEKLNLRPEKFFADNSVVLRAGQRVTAIDRAAKQVECDGRHIPYDRLILATGSRNLIPPIKGVERTIGLRTLDDAGALRSEVERPRKIAVIGGGFIGLEFAAVARGLGHAVTVAEAAPRLMARAVSPKMSERFLEKHTALGADIHLNSLVTEVRENAIQLKDGPSIEADLVLLAAGIVPNSELAEAAGLSVENGVVVNDRLQTSDEHIFALGDCASFPEPSFGQHVRLESVQAATDHARLIARFIATGSSAPYSAVPWFWSDQADWKLQIAGLARPDDEAVEVSETTVLRFDGERLSAVETINEARTHMKTRRMLAGEDIPSRSILAARGFELEQA